MKVWELIEELLKCDPEDPICINDYMGFAEADEENIKVEKKQHRCFPFSESDKFNYVNLRSEELDI